MTREIQHSSGRRRQSSLPAVVPSTPPFDPELLRLRVNYFGLTAVPSTLLLTAMTGGQFGESALVAVLLGGAAGYFGPKLHRKIAPGMRVAGQALAYLGRNHSVRTRHRLLDKNWWLTGEVSIPYVPLAPVAAPGKKRQAIEQAAQRTAPAPTTTPTKKGLITWGTSVQFGKRFDPPFNQLFGRGALFTGTQGAGKSNLIALTVISAARNDIPVFLVDYKNEFYTLRDVLPNVVLCGHPSFAQHAGSPYYPLTKDDAAEFAAAIMENGWQAIFNVRSYRHDLDEMAEVLAAMLRAIVDWTLEQDDQEDGDAPRIPGLVITDEAHNMVPEKPELSALPIEAKSFKLLKKAYVDVANAGRSFGLTMIMATQRLANIAKWSVANLQIQVIMRQDLINDIERCKEYVGAEQIKVLPDLPAGKGFVKGLSKSPMLVQFDEQEARHVSKTPDLSNLKKRYHNKKRLPPGRVLSRRIEGTNEYENPHDRDSNPGRPEIKNRPNLSVVPPHTGTPEDVPEMDAQSPAERTGLVPDVFIPGPDDLLLSGVQIRLLKVFYEDCKNVRKSLQQIRDEKGQGLGSRYAKHASFILEQSGLKKRGA
ncbi:MAG TPA: hypothetical protein VFA10_30245 [Ktedonobacteraceae bacterium]|nr:hypothetical protein [Ktedonobacteraceae bacterium]